MRDVVIVGAGISGLASAFGLGEHDVIVLEREDRAGGRVLTRSQQGVAYELGALFAYYEAMAPFDLGPLDLIHDDGPIGLSDRGVLYLGDTVMSVVTAAGLDGAELQRFCKYDAQLEVLSTEMQRVLGAFFKVIHPGPIEVYVPERQRDAAASFPTPRHQGRNRGLVEAYLQRLRSPILFGADVLQVEDDGTSVTTTYTLSGRTETVQSRALIMTAPSPIARKVLSVMRPAARSFLDAVDLATFTVCVLGLRGAPLVPFRYVATPDVEICAVYQQRDGDVTVLVVYFDHPLALSDAEIVELTRREVSNLGAGEIGDVVFSDIRRWENVGPLITPAAYVPWTSERLSASPRVVLAGDYTSPEFPYGMRAAAESGTRAARDVSLILAPDYHEMRAKS